MTPLLYLGLCCAVLAAFASGGLLGLWFGQRRADRWQRRFESAAADNAELESALEVAQAVVRHLRDPNATTVLPVLATRNEATQFLGRVLREDGDR